MKICVLSDIHFKYIQSSPDDKANARIVLSFLREAVGRYDLMVLNGDIFDLWYDWKYTIIKQYFPLLHRLAEIGEQGCKLVLISGNHDFWFNSFLRDYLRMEIHDDLYRLEADGKKMLFTHGDLHTVNDVRYKILRKVIRMKGVRLVVFNAAPGSCPLAGAQAFPLLTSAEGIFQAQKKESVWFAGLCCQAAIQEKLRHRRDGPQPLSNSKRVGWRDIC